MQLVYLQKIKTLEIQKFEFISVNFEKKFEKNRYKSSIKVKIIPKINF